MRIWGPEDLSPGARSDRRIQPTASLAPDVPVLGDGLATSRDPLGAFRRWARSGDVVRLGFPGRSMYLPADPGLVRRVLVDEQGAYTIGRSQHETFAGAVDDSRTTRRRSSSYWSAR